MVGTRTRNKKQELKQILFFFTQILKDTRHKKQEQEQKKRDKNKQEQERNKDTNKNATRCEQERNKDKLPKKEKKGYDG